MTLSHEDYLLLILADGQWHSLAEILRRHPMMAHSRASSLREKGYNIQHRCIGKGAAGSEYRLLTEEEASTGASMVSSSVSGLSLTEEESLLPVVRVAPELAGSARTALRSESGDPHSSSVSDWPLESERDLGKTSYGLVARSVSSGPDPPPSGAGSPESPARWPLIAAPSDREDQERSGQAGQLSLLGAA